MNIELNAELDARAVKHAALSDRSRLQIVDLLTLGDLSATEIRVALGAPSNLIAHHLNVLESAGMIFRTASEADRRRSYIHLTEHALDGLIAGSVRQTARVVFVCTANSARSQLAAAMWARTSAIPATSGGTQPADRIDANALAIAERHGLPLADARPRALADVLAESDFVITVCDNAHEHLGATGSLHWSIPDPVRIGTDAAFETTYTELERRIDELAPRLAAS